MHISSMRKNSKKEKTMEKMKVVKIDDKENWEFVKEINEEPFSAYQVDVYINRKTKQVMEVPFKMKKMSNWKKCVVWNDFVIKANGIKFNQKEKK